MATKEYVSRGAFKILGIADKLDFKNKIVADIGSSTGGFTEIALKLGAKRVLAVDVGYGLLAWKLRTDPRILVMERVNARHLTELPEPVDTFLIDVSFISLKLIFPAISKIIEHQRKGGYKKKVMVAALIKPQFEATRAESSKTKGIIKDEKVKKRVVGEIEQFAKKSGYKFIELIASPLAGIKGNEEFFLLLSY